MPLFGDNRYALPKFQFGPGLVNHLEVGRPLEEVKAYSTPHQEHESAITYLGGQTSWQLQHDQLLEAKVTAIPPFQEVTSFGITVLGWNDPGGWGDLLRWGQGANVVRFFPDRTLVYYIESYIQGPQNASPTTGFLGRRTLVLTLRSVSGEPYNGY